MATPSARRSSLHQDSEQVDLDDDDAILNELEDDEDELVNKSEREIEEKYDKGQSRIVIQRNDFLVPNLMEMFDKQEVLDLTPSYQRRVRWNDKKRSHLIESLLMNVPIPPIFLYESEYAKYEVMDGQQRLTAVRSFFKNEFKLRGLRVWKELNGRDARDLPPKIKKGLERRGIAAVIILTESSTDKRQSMDLRQYVFERLNTGGERLNPQEIRNCLYASHFNEMLIELARSSTFTNAWGIPPKESKEPGSVSRRLERNALYSKMADCEIVLRYFLLSDMTSFKSAMKKSLDQCMIDRRNLSKEQCVTLACEYMEVLETASNIFGSSLFKLSKNGSGLTGRRSVPLADAILIAVRSNIAEKEAMIKRRQQIIKATLRVLSDPDQHEILVGKGNTKKHVQARLDLMSETVGRCLH